MKNLSSKAEINFLKALFFLFAFLIMSWVPRFPEVKANLDISNGEFGSIISSSVVGAIIALMTVGHLVHNHGVRPIMRIATVLMAISLMILTTTHSSFVFLISMIIQAGAIAAFHISINTQGFDFQDRTKINVIVMLSGWWSSGLLVTAVIAGLLVNQVSLKVHIFIVSLSCLSLIFYIISRINQKLLLPNQDKESDYKFVDVFKGFRVDSLVSSALFCSVSLEFAVGDWAAIYVKEDIGIKSGLHTLPYILFTFSMIIGRLRVHYLFSRFSLQLLMKVGSIVSGVSFLAGIFLTSLIAPENQMLILVILSISFTISGLGASFLTPSVMNIANSRSASPASVVIGQMGVINNIAVFVMRVLIAWTAQVFSLSIALVIPSLLILSVFYFSKISKRA